ncbi:hypothetical protein O1157_31615 [Streptomyces albogriseolus]
MRTASIQPTAHAVCRTVPTAAGNAGSRISKGATRTVRSSINSSSNTIGRVARTT